MTVIRCDRCQVESTRERPIAFRRDVVLLVRGQEQFIVDLCEACYDRIAHGIRQMLGGGV